MENYPLHLLLEEPFHRPPVVFKALDVRRTPQRKYTPFRLPIPAFPIPKGEVFKGGALCGHTLYITTATRKEPSMENLSKMNKREKEEMLNEPPHDYDPPPRGFCPGCGRNVVAVELDAGIGSYEFWGARGYDSCPYWACPKCDMDLSEVEPTSTPCHSCAHHPMCTLPSFEEDKECADYHSQHDVE